MKKSEKTKDARGFLCPWWMAIPVCVGIAGTAFALSEALETDSDSDAPSEDLEFLERIK